MNNLLNTESTILSKYSSDMSMIEHKLSCNKSLNFQEKVKYKMRAFLLHSYIKCDDIKTLSHVNNNKCVICDDVYYIKHMINEMQITHCYLCKYAHFIGAKLFVICDKCINVCMNITIPLTRPVFTDHNYMSFVTTNMYGWYGDIKIFDSNVFDSNVFYAINMIDKIIDNYSNLADRYYNINNNVGSLLMLCYYDHNSTLIMIPKDVTIYVLKIIYDDEL